VDSPDTSASLADGRITRLRCAAGARESQIHDRDAKFSRTFDALFDREKMRVIRTPVKAPNDFIRALATSPNSSSVRDTPPSAKTIETLLEASWP